MADGRERGGATGVEMALLWAAMLAFILAVAQVALVFYAGQLALTAAQDGLHTGRTYPAVYPSRPAPTPKRSCAAPPAPPSPPPPSPPR